MMRLAYSPRCTKSKRPTRARPATSSTLARAWTSNACRDLDQAMEDAVTYKFITKALTKTELDDLFKYRIK